MTPDATTPAPPSDDLAAQLTELSPLDPDKPTFLVAASSPSPYRLSQHLRYARELTEVNLVSLFIDHQNWQPWSTDLPPEIRPLVVSRGTGQNQGGPLANLAKGTRVLEVVDRLAPVAVLLTGYNSLGKLRILDGLRTRRIPCMLFADSNIVADNATGPKLALKKLLVRWVINRTGALLPCGTQGRRFFERYGGRADNMFFVPHGPNFDELATITDADVSAALAKHTIPEGRQRVIYCARMVEVKRPDLLVDAFIAIADERPDLDLVMVGDGPLREGLEHRLPAPISPRVHFTGFVNDAREIYALYRAADLFVLPSKWEPWGAVVPEAVGCGCAIIASDAVGAAPDLVEDDVNGYQFRSQDLRDLTDTLRKATEPDALTRLRAGTKTVLERYRTTHDSVINIRRALHHVGAITPSEPTP
ncbi:MAG: glycosyltransferase family 4 protein [Planctomycetota bacterium]